MKLLLTVIKLAQLVSLFRGSLAPQTVVVARSGRQAGRRAGGQAEIREGHHSCLSTFKFLYFFFPYLDALGLWLCVV